jgi:DNA-binding beta-propeller fold protein YncE
MQKKISVAPPLRGFHPSIKLAGVLAGLFIPTGALAQQLSYLNNLGFLYNPNAAAVGPDGTVYITDPGDHVVNIYSPTGTPEGGLGLDEFGHETIDIPYGLAVSSSNAIYISDAGNNNLVDHPQIEVYVPPYTTNQQNSFGTSGTGNGQFTFPAGIAVNSALGYVYVADFDENRIQIFDTTGTYIDQFGQGILNTPVGLSLGSNGNLYVADGNNNTIDIFDPYGNQISSFGSLGSGPGQLHSPTGVAVSATGMIYVADANNNRVDIFNSADVFQGSVSTAGGRSLNVPYGVAVAPTGMVYVAEQVGNTADRFFDPASWVSGTNIFTDPSIGPTSLNVGTGEILGSSLTLSSARGLVVGGTLQVDPSGTFTLAGGTLSTSTLEVAGTFVEQSGSLSVATLDVDSGGIFQDNQVLALPVTNQVVVSGELLLDNAVILTTPTVYVQDGGVLAAGETTVSASAMYVANGGEVQLTNPVSSNLQIPSIINDGLIDGSGRVTGTLTNNFDGELSASTAQTLVISGAGNTNAGLISLAGGTIHFTHDLQNLSGGLVAGVGTLRVDGGLTNDGTLALAGSSSVFGAVANNSDGTIHLSGAQPNVFFGTVNNAGALNIDAGATGTFYGAYTGAGSVDNMGSVYFNANSISGPITGGGILNLGSQATPAILHLTAGAGVSVQSGLHISAGSSLDIAGNDFILQNTLAGSLFAELKAGFNAGHGYWNGTGGIVSTAAASDTSHLTTIGYRPSSGGLFDGINTTTNDTLVKYTYYGDANLDGAVNGADYQQIDNGLGLHLTGWSNGDFN